MAEAISGNTRVAVTLTSTDTEGAANQTGKVSESIRTTYANGTADGQIDRCAAPEDTLAPATPVSFNLEDGSMTGPLGDAQDFDKLDVLHIENKVDTNPLEVSGNLLGLGTDSLVLPPGGVLHIEYGGEGLAVVGTSADTITLESTLGTDYKLVVAGRSA